MTPHREDEPAYTDDKTTPVDLGLSLRDQVLRITWADGRRDVFSLAMLRGKCPCAGCRTEREQRDARGARGASRSLPILSTKPVDDLRVVNGALCGNYAIQLTWSDGHDTGLFDFRYLRAIAEDQRTSASEPGCPQPGGPPL